MPYTCNWYDLEESIVYVVYDGEWALQDFYDSLQTIADFNQLNPDIRHDIIIHIHTSPHFNIPLFHTNRASRGKQELAGLVILVAEKPFDQMMVQILIKVNKRYRRADTVAAAVELIRAARQEQFPS